MGPLKDALYIAVWSHLQGQPRCRTLMTALNHPTTGSQFIRMAWSSLKENGKHEGMKKATGLQALLQERSDVFEFTTTERGHQLIGLTEGAQSFNPADGLPPNIQPAALPGAGDSAEGAAAQPPPETVAPLAELSCGAPAEASSAGPPRRWTSDPAANSGCGTAAAEERPAKAPRLDKGKGKGKDLGKSRHGAPYVWNVGYRDLVWTPEMQQKKESEQSKENALAWALYKAVEMHGGQNVTLSQLGSDFKVAELKKDPHFKNWRLLDILKEYEDVFELTPSAAAAGGMIVRLQPGAEAALPDAESRAEQVNDDVLLLPDRIENPRTMVDKVQALRIELLHALQRRGGRCAIQELGQEPRLQEKKKLVHQAKKLIDWVKIFPDNFLISSDGQQMVVELASADVRDTRMIEKAVMRREDQDRGGNSCKSRIAPRDSGRDAVRDRRDAGSGRSRYEAPAQSRSAAYQPMPVAYPGYAAAPPPQPLALGYGVPPAGHYGYPPGQAAYQPAGYGGSQPSHYSPASAGYQQPTAYQQLAGYQPAPGYQQPTPGYQQPAPGYPPQAASYPQPAAGYPPAAGGYPAPGGGYPPQAGGYPPQGGYPPPVGYPLPVGY